jgi:hypothetical protein
MLRNLGAILPHNTVPTPAVIVLAGPERKSEAMNSIPPDCFGERSWVQRQVENIMAM